MTGSLGTRTSTDLVIRRALPGDRTGVVATVAAAFAQDPGWAFVLGEEYEALVAHFVGALFDIRACIPQCVGHR